MRDPRWLTAHDPRRTFVGAKSPGDVAVTIWPAKLARRCATRADLYERYKRIYARGKRRARNRSTWGTYVLRLIAFGAAGTRGGTNQLEAAITKINTWPKRAAAAIVFHLSSPALDPPRTRGGPCLQYLEILWNADGSLDMVAVYRSHDYSKLAFGNFIGLCDLLCYICGQTGKIPGTLTVHSVYAFIDGSERTRLLLAQASCAARP